MPQSKNIAIDSSEVKIIEPLSVQYDTSVGSIRISSIVEEKNLVEDVKFFQTANEDKQIAFDVDKKQEVNLAFSINNSSVKSYPLSSSIDLLDGNNVLLLFAVDARGISMKSEKTIYLQNHYIGEGSHNFDAESPHLFLNLPNRKEYRSSEHGLILDFVSVNQELNPKGNQVEVLLDDIRVYLPYWQAYRIEGLEVGKHRIKIRLIDADGNWIPGPFNDSGYRTFEIFPE